MNNLLRDWIDSLDLCCVPEEVEAFCFNLYDNCDNENWSAELIGASCFDEDNEDWPCDEVTDFGSRDNAFCWKRKAEWDVVLEEMVTALSAYLTDGMHSAALKSRKAVAVGFTDGDLEILYNRD